MDSMDLGLARKPVRDVKNKEKIKKKNAKEKRKRPRTEETDRDPTVRTRDVFRRADCRKHCRNLPVLSRRKKRKK